MMLILPIQSHNHERDAIIIVLGQDNIDRMKQHDPAALKCYETGKTLVNPVIMLAYEDESPEFSRVVQCGNIGSILEFLQRGKSFQPDRGDHDRGPESISGLN